MKYLTYPVVYLEESDFNEDGTLKNIPKSKPVFILLQSLNCYHCSLAKPAFQELCKKNPDIICATIQMDLIKTQSFANIIDKIYPNLIGYPSYVLLFNDNKMVYDGDRTVQDMDNFLINVI